MASCVTELITSCSNILLSATALFSSYRLFKIHVPFICICPKRGMRMPPYLWVNSVFWRTVGPPTSLSEDHRAPSVGLLLLGLSAALNILHPSSSSYLASIQREAEWASEVLAPALVSFDFLWLSEDHNTAHILLCGSCLLLGLCDWLSADALTLMTRCLGLSSLSCCLTVCLFAGNALGGFGGVALSLPLLVAQRVRTDTFAPLISPAATEGLIKWLLKGSMSVGCWASTRALSKFLLDVTDHLVNQLT